MKLFPNTYHNMYCPKMPLSLQNTLLFLLLILSLSNFLLLLSLPFTKDGTALAVSTQTLGEDTSSIPNQITLDNVILHGTRDKKQIALTFDADMTQYMKDEIMTHAYPESINRQLISILEQTQTKATIFITGMWAQMYPDVTKQLAQNPLFEIGSHSYSHQSFAGKCYDLGILPKDQITKEIGYTEGLLEQIAGVKVQLFRFPGGCYDLTSVAAVNKAGEHIVHWDVAGDDGFNLSAPSIIHNVLSQTRNGSIIILHFNGPPTAPKTAEALPTIISTFKEQGYEFVKINELLGLPAEQKIN